MQAEHHINILRNPENYIHLTQMLCAREERVNRQSRLLSSVQQGCLICFTLNIAGPYKTSPLLLTAFQEGEEKITQLLTLNKLKILSHERYIEPTGYESYFVVDNDAMTIKNLTVQIEDSLKIGRLFDIDVLKLNGEKISRKDIGKQERSCLICNKIGAGCSSRRSHSPEQLQEKTIALICEYFNEKFCDKIACTAVKALLYEVSVTPKPGLVDRHCSGAHKDMDFFTFIDSAAAISPYFKQCADLGVGGGSAQEVFKNLRMPGQFAEIDMLTATNGVNTHKGAIFSLGIICGACGYLYGLERPITAENILDTASQMAKVSVKDFEQLLDKTPKTFGEKIFLQQNITGVRGEASAGFPSVKNIGYPAFLNCLHQGYSLNDSGAIALLNMICYTQDTNIIKRAGVEKLAIIQEEIKKEIDKNKNIMSYLSSLNQYFITENISPGGCADLLSVIFMLYFLSA